MDEQPEPTAPTSGSGHVLVLALVAVGGLVSFRVGLLAGGLVGVDLAMALIGWWFASNVAAGAAFGELLGLVWRRLWPSLLVAVVLATGWVLVVPSTRLDPLVRGQVLGLFGGYGNWHQLALGPAEVARHRLTTPLQHLWVVGVLVSCIGALGLAVWASRPRARRRVGQRDPLVLLGLGVSASCAAATVISMVLGASGQGLLLVPFAHGVALFAGVAWGATGPGPGADAARSILWGVRWFMAAGLAVAALVAAPDSDWWRLGGAVAVPLVAAAVVAAWTPWPPGALSPARPHAIDHWMVLISTWVFHVPALALLAPARTSLPAWLASALGVALAVGLGVAVTTAASVLSVQPASIEVRKVVLPPIAVLLVVLLFSATGAFHWSSPHPRPGAAPTSGH